MYNLLITGVISPRPLILIGEGWQSTFGCFFDTQGEYVSRPDRAWLRFAEDIEINSLNFISTISKSGSKTLIPIPFNPNESWGQKEHHYIAGSINGRPFRGSIISDGAHFFLLIGAAWCRDAHLTPGDTVEVTIAPEGPQVDRMSSDIAQALDAEPQARAFFESLATFYRKNYIRWIESAKRPETRQARITELVRLLVAGKKQK